MWGKKENTIWARRMRDALSISKYRMSRSYQVQSVPLLTPALIDGGAFFCPYTATPSSSNEQ
jgi:hypothetical protein